MTVQFNNEANTSQDVAVDLSSLQQQVDVAIESAINDVAQKAEPSATTTEAPATPANDGTNGGAQGGPGGGDLYSDMLSSKMFGGTRAGGIVAFAAGIQAEVRGGGTHSRFWPNGANQTSTKSNPNPTSRFMPTTYAERVRDARKPAQPAKDIMGRPVKKKPGGPADLVERAGLAGRSLTGDNDCHAKPCMIRGLKADPQIAATLGLIPSYLLQASGDIRKARTGPKSLQQLQDGLKNGNDDAEHAAEVLGQNNPLQQQSMLGNQAPKLASTSAK